MKKIFIILAIVALFSGCAFFQGASNSESFQRTERATYEAVAPDYTDMFEGRKDPLTLTPSEVRRREGMVRTWELRVQETETPEDDVFFLKIGDDYRDIFRGDVNPILFNENEREQRRENLREWDSFIDQIVPEPISAERI